MAIAALVRASIGLIAHVDLGQSTLELWCTWLFQHALVILCNHGDAATIHRTRAWFFHAGPDFCKLIWRQLLQSCRNFLWEVSEVSKSFETKVLNVNLFVSKNKKNIENKQTSGTRHGMAWPPLPPHRRNKLTLEKPLDCHLPAKKVCLFWSTEKKDFVGGQKFVSAPETRVSVRKRFVFPKLTNLCLHPSGLRGLALNQALVFGRCTTAHDCRRQLRA